jgi:parallel beta-helix repeat protein
LNKTATLVFVLLLCCSVICVAAVYGNLSSEDQKQNLNPDSTSQDKISTPKLDSTPSGPPLGAIVVPDDFPTIYQAVNNASDNDTVYVRSGQYNESVTIDKSLNLMGEDKQAKVDANSVAPNFLITNDNVNVTGFFMVNTATPGSDGPFWMPNYVYPTYKPNIVIHGSANCHIFGNSLSSAVAGVLLENSVQCSVIDNEVGGGNGVELQSSTGNYVADNVVNGAAAGLWIQNSANNTFVNNIISRTVTGVWLSAASGNTFRDNLLVGCFYNFGITGNERLAYINDVDASNLIDGKPIIYLVGKTGQVVPANASSIILADCTDMVIQDFSLALSYRGIVLANTNDSTIRNTRLGSVNTTWQEDFGQKALDIQLVSSFGNSIESNYGNVWLNFSSNNRITHNTGVIRIENSNSNQIIQNTITPISFLSTDRGIQLSNSENNRIQGNTIYNSGCGIFLGDYANSNSKILLFSFPEELATAMQLPTSRTQPQRKNEAPNKGFPKPKIRNPLTKI